jgi:hypothetical protein
MKNLVFLITMSVALLEANAQEKIFVGTEQDLINNDLYGTYKTDGYYFYIIKSHENLFEIRYEMNWYDENKGKSIVLDRCNGFVNFMKGKLLLEWNPCNNVNSFRDVQIIPNDPLELIFYKEGGEIYIKFNGSPLPHKVG